MPDLADLLDRATPGDLPPLDLDRLARAARARRRRRRMLPVAAVVLALVGGFVVVEREGRDDRRSGVAAESALGASLSEPVGAWRAGSAPPFGARGSAFAATLSDGRALVWGGGSGNEGGMTELDGGVYDPEADRWEPVPSAPIGPVVTVHWVQLSADRLVALGTDATDGTLHGAVYDAATGEWTELPPQDRIHVAVDGMAWDGQTLAIVRLRRGSDGFLDTGVDWRVGAPVTLRWSLGDDTWSEGTAPPTGHRFGAAVAFDGQRLAVVSGTETSVEDRGAPVGAGPDPGIAADGALYDLAADRWIGVPPMPGGGAIWPTASWLDDGRLVVGGGSDRLADPGPERSALVAYDPGVGAWHELSTAPGSGVATSRGWARYSTLDRTVVVQPATTGRSGPQPRRFYGPAGWEEAPLNDLHRIGGLFVATSAAQDNPGDEHFRLAVRAGEGVWLDGAAAEFTNRMDPAVVAVGTKLLVVGGEQGEDLSPTGDLWVFDLDP